MTQSQHGGAGRQQEPESVSEGFGMTVRERSGETAAMVVAEQAKAEIQARRFLALQFPRDMDNVRQKILKECERPGFADAAIYEKPMGRDKIEGLSIRFAEAAIRCMGNLGITNYSIYDDRFKRIVRSSVEDYESNTIYSLDITLDKTVERRDASGREIVTSRTNKQGEQVYVVIATEDELLTKQNAWISKAIRTNGLRHVPGDILDEAKAECYRTSEKRDAQDPNAARNKLYDSFAIKFGIMPSQLKEYLGHANDPTPVELRELRGVFAMLQDGEYKSFKDLLDAKNELRKAKGEAKDETPQAKDLKDKLQKRDEQQKLIEDRKKAEAAAAGKAGAGGTGGAGGAESKGEPAKTDAPKSETKAEGKAGKGGKSAPEGQGTLGVDDAKKKDAPPDPDNDGR